MTRPRVHPGPSAYNNGCRCGECVELHRRRCERIRAELQARPRDQVPHGTQHGYTTWGCRCEPCTEANKAKCKEYGQRLASASP